MVNAQVNESPHEICRMPAYIWKEGVGEGVDEGVDEGVGDAEGSSSSQMNWNDVLPQLVSNTRFAITLFTMLLTLTAPQSSK